MSPYRYRSPKKSRTAQAPAARTATIPAVVEVTQKIKQDLRMGREYQQGRINWITTIAMGLFHVGAIAALFFFSWKNLAAFVIMYFFAINVGIGMAYHRLLTHRGYQHPQVGRVLRHRCAAPSRSRAAPSSG